MGIGLFLKDCEMSHKTRDLELYDYFVKLQEEFIVAELRKKIYPRIKDKKYWNKVMEYKRKKIEDITFRNSLNSIFNNDKVKEKYYNRIYQSNFPNFIYKDNQDFKELSELDKFYYYNVGSKFVIIKDGEEVIGELDSISNDFSHVFMKINDCIIQFDIKLIKRIL